MKADEIKARLSKETISDILTFNGFRVDTKTFMTSLTDDDKTPSSKINDNGSIHSFNDDFHGDLFDVLQTYRGMGFEQALEVVKSYLGINISDGNYQYLKPVKQPTKKKPSYNIEKLHKQFKQDGINTSTDILIPLSDELISKKLWSSLEDRKSAGAKISKYLGYSSKDRSLTISLFNGDKIECIAIRKSGNIKWKTLGSKTFIPSNLDDDFIFIASGMSEILLFEMLNFSYLLLQSDSVYKHLEQFREPLKDKVLIVLQENDNSSKKLTANLKQMFSELEIVVIDFTKVLNRDLVKGYDFRDFCNEIENVTEIKRTIENEILKGLENV